MNLENWNSKEKQIYGGGTVAVAVLLGVFAFSGDEVLPVRVEILADIGNDAKARIYNNTDKDMTVVTTLENPELKDKYPFTQRIKAGKWTEIGWLEARKLYKGDIITVHREEGDYKDYVKIID
jgi:hypothetical protein